MSMLRVRDRNKDQSSNEMIFAGHEKWYLKKIRRMVWRHAFFTSYDKPSKILPEKLLYFILFAQRHQSVKICMILL